MLSVEDKIEIQAILDDFREELRTEFAKEVIEADYFPTDKDDKVFLIKNSSLYISTDNEWKLIANLH